MTEKSVSNEVRAACELAHATLRRVVDGLAAADRLATSRD